MELVSVLHWVSLKSETRDNCIQKCHYVAGALQAFWQFSFSNIFDQADCFFLPCFSKFTWLPHAGSLLFTMYSKLSVDILFSGDPHLSLHCLCSECSSDAGHTSILMLICCSIVLSCLFRLFNALTSLWMAGPICHSGRERVLWSWSDTQRAVVLDTKVRKMLSLLFGPILFTSIGNSSTLSTQSQITNTTTDRSWCCFAAGISLLEC